MLTAAATLVLFALQANAADMQPSAQRVLVAAVIALICPLFWPGRAKNVRRTAITIAVWCCAASLIAGLALLLLRGGAAHAGGRIAVVCVMLLLILLVTHAVAAGL